MTGRFARLQAVEQEMQVKKFQCLLSGLPIQIFFVADSGTRHCRWILLQKRGPEILRVPRHRLKGIGAAL